MTQPNSVEETNKFGVAPTPEFNCAISTIKSITELLRILLLDPIMSQTHRKEIAELFELISKINLLKTS